MPQACQESLGFFGVTWVGRTVVCLWCNLEIGRPSPSYRAISGVYIEGEMSEL